MSHEPQKDQLAKSRSTIIEKIPVDIRGDIDRAAVNRAPPLPRRDRASSSSRIESASDRSKTDNAGATISSRQSSRMAAIA